MSLANSVIRTLEAESELLKEENKSHEKHTSPS
jgi:hypothetical protein